MDAVVESVRPTDGTLDAEASRDAIRRALSEVLTRFPDASLLDLSEAERAYAVECFVARDVYYRFQLDVGQALQSKAPTAEASLSRANEVLEYVKQVISAAFRKLERAGQKLTTSTVTQVAQAALRETFAVFEERSA